MKHGIALVPESRQEHGLVLISTVEKNIALPNLDRMFGNGWVRPDKIHALGEQYVNRLNIRTPSLVQRVMYLSGGNQQKVVLAK